MALAASGRVMAAPRPSPPLVSLSSPRESGRRGVTSTCSPGLARAPLPGSAFCPLPRHPESPIPRTRVLRRARNPPAPRGSGPSAVPAACAGRLPHPRTSPNRSPWSPPLRSATAWFEFQTGLAEAGARPGQGAAGGVRRASPRSALARGSPPAPRWPRPQLATPAPRRSPARHRPAAFPALPPACAAPRRGPRRAAATRGPGCLGGRMASGDSPPAVRGASASLGSRPRSPNLLFAAEPPERLGVESCCNVAPHRGWRCRWQRLGSPAGSVRSVRGARARLRRSLPGQVSVSWSFELRASVRVALKRVRLEVPEPNLGFLPIGAISNLHARSFLYRLILVWQEKIAVIPRAHSCGRLKFIALAEAR